MKAVRYHRTGGPEVLQIDEVEKPLPRGEEVLVRIQRAGLNFADTLQRRGRYIDQPEPPVLQGLEASGVIEAVGEKQAEYRAGTRVAVIGRNLHAEYATVHPRQLIPLPEGVDAEAGAAFPIQALTAYHILHTSHHLRAGQTVLVHAAAGGVGLLAVQMAKLAGATVYGTVSTEEKASLARQMGADEVIHYREGDFAAEVLRLTGDRGVDLILDAVGKDTLHRGLRALAPHGNLVVYGAASGVPDPVRPEVLLRGSKQLTGFVLYTLLQVPGRIDESLEKIFSWLGSGELKLTISHRFPLERVAEAHALLEGRRSTGKILLEVSDGD